MGHLVKEMSWWINERYRILLNRKAGLPPPWTSDPVLASVRFCNVHREDDKVTQWIRKYWNYATDHPWKFILGRMVNWPETLDAFLACDTDILAMKAEMKRLRSQGKKVWTNVYTISTCGQRIDKIDYVFDQVIIPAAHIDAWDFRSLEAAYNDLRKVPGLGSFLSGQVIADMKNTPGHILRDALDWWVWSTPGPGSLRGLNWFFFKDSEGPITASTYRRTVKECYDLVIPHVADTVPPISMQDFQNCLCEFSKYCKVKFDNGHVRNKYVARI